MDSKTIEWAEAQAQLYQILTNPRRVLILRVLAEHEMSVSEIALLVSTSMQNTSQHLRLMKERGILTCRRDRQTIYYRVADLAVLEKLGLTGSEPNS